MRVGGEESHKRLNREQAEQQKNRVGNQTGNKPVSGSIVSQIKILFPQLAGDKRVDADSGSDRCGD